MATSGSSHLHDASRLTLGQGAAAMLRTRCDAVWAELRAACALPGHVEHVHQLRVATRRALAAFDVFRDLIPTRQRHWFEHRLRRLRRVAGEARDLDVLTARLTHDGAVRARSRMVGLLAQRRQMSQALVGRQLRLLTDAGWTSRVDRLVADVRRRRPSVDVRDRVRRRLVTLVESFFKKADRKLRRSGEIHAARIAGKKLRYALEMLGQVLPEIRPARCQESLERLQERLGKITDHAAAAIRCERWARGEKAGPDRDELLRMSDAESWQADKSRKAFSAWWDPVRRRSLRDHFEHALRRLA